MHDLLRTNLARSLIPQQGKASNILRLKSSWYYWSAQRGHVLVLFSFIFTVIKFLLENSVRKYLVSMRALFSLLLNQRSCVWLVFLQVGTNLFCISYSSDYFLTQRTFKTFQWLPWITITDHFKCKSFVFHGTDVKLKWQSCIFLWKNGRVGWFYNIVWEERGDRLTQLWWESELNWRRPGLLWRVVTVLYSQCTLSVQWVSPLPIQSNLIGRLSTIVSI